jgi:N-acetylmuramoyl-L-alanine amidase
MQIRSATAIIILLLTAALSGQAGPPPQTLYADAQAKEKAVRSAMTGSVAPDALRRAVRTVAADYESLVRRHPASAYADDALWSAGSLLIDAFKRVGDPQDRDDAARVLRWLTTEYPTSTHATQVPSLIAATNKITPRPQAPPQSQTPPVPAAATSTPPPGSTSAPTSTATALAAMNRAQQATAPSAVSAPAPPPPATAAPPAPAPATPPARRPTGPATISDIHRTVLPEAVRVTIALDRDVTYRLERLAAPERVYVDLSPSRFVPALVDRTIRFDGDANPVRQIRTGRHPNDTSRIVLETADVTGCRAYPLQGPDRLVIECLRTKPALPSVAALPPPPARATRPAPPSAAAPQRAPTAPPTIKPTKTVANWARALPSAPANASRALAAIQATPRVTGTALRTPAPTTLPAPPARNLAGGFSLARQLGLGVSRVVIDPGHGGQDPGGKAAGVTEADLVLDIALRLEKLLVVTGTEVVLTRRRDEFVSLEGRTAIANREAADLFLSIHTNASSSASATGVETYYLNFANTLGAAAVAARENAASGRSMNALPDTVKTIALNTKLDESRDFATLVQRELVTRLRPANKAVKDLGVKQAPFVVLIGAAMPSVLTEISFLTNAQEARLLSGAAYRQRIAEALFNAIRKYQGSLKRVEKAD